MKILAFLLLAVPALILCVGEFYLPWTARGAGGVELASALLLLVAAAWLVFAQTKLATLLCIVPFVVFLGRSRLNAQSDLQRQTCVKNLDFLAGQVAEYRQKRGKFPQTLEECAMRSLPLCPCAERETYSAGYTTSDTDFTLCCKGEFHCRHFYDPPSAKPDFPCYSSATGKLLPLSEP